MARQKNKVPKRSKPRKGARRGRAATVEDHVERLGHAALTSSWTAVVRTSGATVRGMGRGTAFAGRWLRDQSPVRQLVAVGLALAAGVLSVGFAQERWPVMNDREALARVIHSECGVCSTQQKLHIAWATRNLARVRDQSVASMVCSPCGPQQRGRPVSSRLRANRGDRALAEYVLEAPLLADPTGGATHFVNPQLQDQLARTSDRPGYRGKPYSAVRRRWLDVYRWRPYYRLGPDLELWGPKRESD